MKKFLAFLMIFTTLNLMAGEKMQIIIKNKNGEFMAVLDDTKAARSFLAQLPLTLNLSDYAKTEKFAKLKTPLDVSEAPKGAEGKRGELSYFAPWQNFVIYYGYQPYYNGIVRLGELVGGTIDMVAIDGEVAIESAK